MGLSSTRKLTFPPKPRFPSRQLRERSVFHSACSVSAQISATMAAISRSAASSSAPRRCISPSNAFPSSLTQLTSVRSMRMAAPPPACSQQLRSSFTQAPANLPSSLKAVTPAPLFFVIFSIVFHYCRLSLPLLPYALEMSSPTLTAQKPMNRSMKSTITNSMISLRSPFFDQRCRSVSQLIQSIQRRDLVGLGERRVVEHRVPEVLDRRARVHNRLSDVNE